MSRAGDKEPQTERRAPADVILERLQMGQQTWEDLKTATGLSNDLLGDVLARLYDHDRVKPVSGAQVRTYKLL